MDSKIKTLISLISDVYQLSGHHILESYDVILSLSSWTALSRIADTGKSRGATTSDFIPDTEFVLAPDSRLLISALKSRERYLGSSWTGALGLDSSLFDGISSSDLRAILTALNKLFQADENPATVLSEIFDQLEYLLSSSQKGDNLYVPPKEIALVMGHYLASNEGITLYDPFSRTGNLIMQALENLPSVKSVFTFAPVNLLWKLTKLRILFLSQRRDINIGKEFSLLKLVDRKFDFIICNPPFGQHAPGDRQFSNIGGEWEDLIRKSRRIELFYLAHILTHLADSGRATVLLPGIFLSDSLAVREITGRLIEQNLIDAVISMPGGLFTQTGISTVMVCINKARTEHAPVLIADAAAEVERLGRQLILKPEKVLYWLDKLKTAESIKVDRYAVMVSTEEIRQHSFELMIKSYIGQEVDWGQRVSAKELKVEYEKLEGELFGIQKDIDHFLSNSPFLK
ncbi:N-6 DNA methylase [Pedobacter nototheniae]|uniref:N-6 DNA methylase n=1 Tax=Pedobacter nototheniae TaxID=2488994 RepID=UPI00103EB7FC|nr:N-6 DNA methylase [Pedobacter nototheniae]